MIMKKIITACIAGVVVSSCIFGAHTLEPSIRNSIMKLEFGEGRDIKSEKDKKANSDIYGFVPYKVKKGDTVYGICRESVVYLPTNKAAAMIIEKNNLKGNDDITDGQIIYIPYKDPGNSIEYIVKSGDTIYTIASNLMPGQNADESVDDIMEENDLSSANDIKEGQILLIPHVK
jgi:LysM repeat protein